MKACFSRCLLLTESERCFYESLSKERGRWLNLFVCIQAICELSQLICASVTQTSTNWNDGQNAFQIVQAVAFFLNAILISLFQFNVISYRAGTFWFSLVEILRVCGSCRVKVLLSSPLDGVLLGYSCVSAVAAVSLSCSIIFQAVSLFVLHVAVMMSSVDFSVIRILTTLLLYLLILSMFIVQLKLTQRDFKLRQHQQAMILTLESMIQVPVILSRFNEREETIELQSVNNAGKAILKVNDLSTLNNMLSQTQLNPLGSNSKPHRNTLPPNNLKTKVRALIDHLRNQKKPMNPMNFLRLSSPINQSQKSIMPSPLYLPSRNSLAQQSNCSQHQSALMKASFSPTKRSPLHFNKSFFRRTSNLPSTHLLPPLRSTSNPSPSPLRISSLKRRSSDISIQITPNCSTPLKSSSADRRPRRNRKNELFQENSNNSSINPNNKGVQSAISSSNATSFYGYIRQDDSSKEERVLIRMWGYYLSEAYVILVVESEADSGKLARERAKQRTFEQECRRFSNELGSMSRILFASLRNKQISLMKTEVQQWQNRNHQHKQPQPPPPEADSLQNTNTNSIQGIIKNSSSIQSNLLCLGQCFKLINCVDNFILSHDSLSGWLLAEKELKNVSLKTILNNLLEVIAPTQKKRTIKSALFFQDSQNNYHHSTNINYNNDYNHHSQQSSPSSSSPSHDLKSNAWMIQSSPKHLTQLLFNILNLSFQLCADDGIVQVQISQSKTQQSLVVSVRHSIGDESFSIFNFTEQQQQAFETSQKILRIVSPYSKFFIKQRVKCYAQIKFFIYEDLSQISEIVRNNRRTVCSKGELENNDQLIEQEDESPSENLSILETIDPLIQEISKQEVVHEGRSFQVGRIEELEENQKENEIVLTGNFEEDPPLKQTKVNNPVHARQASFEKTENQEKYKIKEAENEDESSSESSSSSAVSSQEGKTQKNIKILLFPQRSSLLCQQQQYSNPSSPPSVFLSSRVPSQHTISFRCQQSLHRNSLKNIKGNIPGFSGGPSNSSIRGKSEKSIEAEELEIEYLPWIRISSDETDKTVSPNLAILKNKGEKKQEQQKPTQHFFGPTSGFHTSPTHNLHSPTHESTNSARQSHKIVDLEQSWQPRSITGNNEESQKQQEPNEEITQEELRIPWTRKPRQKIRKHTNRDEIKEDLDFSNGY